MSETDIQSVLRTEAISRQNSLHELLDRIRMGKDIPADIVEEAIVSFLVLLSGDSRDEALDALTSLTRVDQGLTEGIDDSLSEKEYEIEELSGSLLSAYEELAEVLTERLAECTTEQDKVGYAQHLERIVEDTKKLKDQYRMKS